MRNSDRPDGFENQIILLLHLVGHELVSNSARNHDVILGAITLLTEDGLECAAALEHKDDLIRAAVLVILILAVRFFRARTPSGHVLIEKNRDPSGVDIAFARNVRRLEMMMPQRAVSDFLQLLAFQELYVAHARGRPQMIHD